MIGIVQFQTQLLSFSLIVVHFKINIDHSLICYFQKVDIMKRQITAFSLFMCKKSCCWWNLFYGKSSFDKWLKTSRYFNQYHDIIRTVHVCLLWFHINIFEEFCWVFKCLKDAVLFQIGKEHTGLKILTEQLEDIQYKVLHKSHYFMFRNIKWLQTRHYLKHFKQIRV